MGMILIVIHVGGAVVAELKCSFVCKLSPAKQVVRPMGLFYFKAGVGR
jgi:hypothetical protein